MSEFWLGVFTVLATLSLLEAIGDTIFIGTTWKVTRGNILTDILFFIVFLVLIIWMYLG